MTAGEPVSRELIAVTHVPSPRMEAGERTFVGHQAIDPGLARMQHAAYEDALRECGATVVQLDVNRVLPDCVFVEDTAIVLDEVAVMMSMGAESRRGEPAGIEAALRSYRDIERVELPATIDGGDVVRCGRALYVGDSARTNAAGVMALREIVRRCGYTVTAVPVRQCLHLKSACSALPDGSFLVNRDWIDVSPLPSDRLVQVPATEPWAGDVLVIGEQIIVSGEFPRTADLLRDRGWTVRPVDVSEFAKAEGGVTCMSLVFWSEVGMAMGGGRWAVGDERGGESSPSHELSRTAARTGNRPPVTGQPSTSILPPDLVATPHRRSGSDSNSRELKPDPSGHSDSPSGRVHRALNQVSSITCTGLV